MGVGVGVDDLPLVLRHRVAVVFEGQPLSRPDGEARLATEVVLYRDAVRVLVPVLCAHLELPLPVGVVERGQV